MIRKVILYGITFPQIQQIFYLRRHDIMKKTSMIIVSLVLAVYLSACGQDVPTSGNIFDMSQESSDSQDTSTSDNSSETSEESSESY